VGIDDLAVADLLARVAAGGLGPAAGSGCAVAAATGAALAESACRLSGQRWADAEEAGDRLAALRAELLVLADDDAAAVGAAIGATRSGTDAQVAFAAAAAPPLAVAEAAAEVAELAALTAIHGKRTVRSDALAGSLLAEAAARASANLVAVDLAERGNRDVARARWAAERAEAAAERAWRAARAH
jgi:formiminotetrahydrofolate cyclodeaminase